MKRFLKRLFLVLFLQMLLFLTVFYIPEIYFAQWTASFILCFFLFWFLSFRFIPSAKKEKWIKNTISDYKSNLKNLEDIRLDAIKLPFVCPECQAQNTFWSFLENYNCKKCGSEMWSVKIKEYDESYDKLFKKREKVFHFFKNTPNWLEKKIKKRQLSGNDE